MSLTISMTDKFFGLALKRTILLIVLTALPAYGFAAEPSGYSGQEQREIKALSLDDIDAYLTGKGMGMAKAAELNNYPGPKHVLELADNLELTPEQRQQTELLFSNMQNEAITLGKQLIAKEQILDTAFSDQSIQSESLQALLTDIGEISAQLRATHLNAHIQQRKLLNQHQLHQYNQLRGYHSSGEHQH